MGNDFFDKEDLKKVKNIVSSTLKISIEEINQFVEKTKKRRGANLIPVKNKNLVEQKPKEEGISKVIMVISGTLLAIYGIMSIFNLINYFFSYKYSLLKTLFTYQLPVVIISFLFLRYGKRLYARMIRFKKYLREFGNSTVATVKDMAIATNTNPDLVIKELKIFINKGYLKEARLVENQSIIVLDKETYNEYKKYSINIPENKKGIDKVESEFLVKLMKYKKSLPYPIKDSVEELIVIVEKLFTNVGPNSDKDSYDKFINYYLPATIKLLKEYENLENNEMDLENEKELKREIEESLKEIVKAFKKLLESTFEMNYMDIKTDISVLKAMLKNEGLMEDDFK
ncbi:MAG: hypothetical protein ACTHWZ_03670 [Peptoniphilaceae bacterium]